MKYDLITVNENGLYCPAGGFYIDPWRPVERAVITHAHSDHARPGHSYYLAHNHCAPILRLRLGQDINLETMEYGETRAMNGLRVSLHPAGHVLGSAQVRIEHGGKVWVVSGDYKLENDRLTPAFEPIHCHTFITESTFGLPVYKWRPQDEIFEQVNQWWAENQGKNKASILIAYALGKAQRLVENLDHSLGDIYAHGAVFNVHTKFREAGITLPEIKYAGPDMPKSAFMRSLIIAPPSALNTPWMRRFEPYSTAIASGCMAIRGNKRRKAVDRGFALSDHADWQGLNEAINACGAERVFVTHGYQDVMVKWLGEKGKEAHELKTEFVGESEEFDGL
ncbi:MAG TPA: ligase-associated DNA damage response exonuclease [Thermodesulfobacteriota bacterium]|nr:ligase-associated DNA damage response exonuclease [Thermodesulfobacteriota bacterium]